MKIGIVLEDDKGVNGNVCAHFGLCKFFFIADIDNDKKKIEIANTRIVPNTASHGGCAAVDEILKYQITHVIAGGMGSSAQQKFAQAGVQVFQGSGNVQKALDDFMINALSGLDACREYGHGESCH